MLSRFRTVTAEKYPVRQAYREPVGNLEARPGRTPTALHLQSLPSSAGRQAILAGLELGGIRISELCDLLVWQGPTSRSSTQSQRTVLEGDEPCTVAGPRRRRCPALGAWLRLALQSTHSGGASGRRGAARVRSGTREIAVAAGRSSAGWRARRSCRRSRRTRCGAAGDVCGPRGRAPELDR
jgi:hypothetical protein